MSANALAAFHITQNNELIFERSKYRVHGASYTLGVSADQNSSENFIS